MIHHRVFRLLDVVRAQQDGKWIEHRMANGLKAPLVQRAGIVTAASPAGEDCAYTVGSIRHPTIEGAKAFERLTTSDGCLLASCRKRASQYG